jgi:excisionase family DNA binding protein
LLLLALLLLYLLGATVSAEPAEPEPYLVSLDEAARRLGLGKTSVYGLVRAGRLKTVKVGKRHLVPTASLDAYVSSLTND